jgi:hypothetical protein
MEQKYVMHLYNRRCLVKTLFFMRGAFFFILIIIQRKDKNICLLCVVGFRRRVCPSLILIFFVFVSVMCFYLALTSLGICCVWMFGIIFREFFRERADRFLSHFARDEFFFFSNPPVFF